MKKYAQQWLNKILNFLGELDRKNVGIMAAGIAYFTSLAFFPLFATAVAIATIVIQPSQLEGVIQTLHAYLPGDIAGLLSAQLQAESGEHHGSILVIVIGLLVAIFSASGAMDNLIRGLNSAYGVRETRNPIKLKLLSIALTIAGLFGGMVVIALLVVREDFLVHIGVPAIVAALIPVVRWLIVLVLIALAIEVIYRHGTNHKGKGTQLVNRGMLVGTGLWLAITILFFVYAQYFAGFSRSYSVFAGIIVLMIWLNLGAYAILIGAVVDSKKK